MTHFLAFEMDASLPVFSVADSYLFLIDASLQSLVDGVPFLCVNVSLDAWQPLETVPIEVLKQIAMRCVMQRIRELRSNQPLGMHELQKYG